MAPLAAPAARGDYEWSITTTLCLVVLLGICGGLQFGCACLVRLYPPPTGQDPATFLPSHIPPGSGRLAL